METFWAGLPFVLLSGYLISVACRLDSYSIRTQFIVQLGAAVIAAVLLVAPVALLAGMENHPGESELTTATRMLMLQMKAQQACGCRQKDQEAE